MENFVLEYIFAAMLYTECFAGIMINVTILAAICLRWKVLRSQHTYYTILIYLLLCRNVYYLNLIFYDVIFVFYPWILLDKVVFVALGSELMFLYYTNVWFATILCVFYCVKITSYNWKVLLVLKTKISTLVPWLLRASLLISASSSLLFGFYSLEPKNLKNGMENATLHNEARNISVTNQLVIFLLGSCPPFLILCTAICLLLHSLWMHTRRMRGSGSGFRSPNLDSHFGAVKNLSFFLVLQIMYFILMNIIFSGRLRGHKDWRVFVSIITCCPQFFHSLYIISSNSEVKKTCISMLRVRGAH